MQLRIETAGVDSLLLRFSDRVEPELISSIGTACNLLESALDDLIVDLVPSYTTLLVVYDLNRVTEQEIRSQVLSVLQPEQILSSEKSVVGKTVVLPVCYEPSLAPDMEPLQKALGLTREEIIQLHTGRTYQVYAVGFSPGFGYLGELDQRLQLPRHVTPRTRVPAGSVAIAEANTAVYPQETPGGWWLIGSAPLPVFDKTKVDPCLFVVGDRVKFEAISLSEYQRLEALK